MRVKINCLNRYAINADGLNTRVDKFNAFRKWYGTDANLNTTLTINPDSLCYLLIGGWGTDGRSRINLYFVSRNPRDQQYVLVKLRNDLGEITGDYTINLINNGTQIQIDSGPHLNLGFGVCSINY